MKHFALIGDPAEHSLSPIMHQWVFDSLKMDAEYEKIKVKENELVQIIQKMKNGELDGVNITIPHKGTIMEHLDEINPRAKSIGAVNCILKSGSKIIGNNTDWYGFSMALKNNDINLIGREVIVLGAGGSAKSILYALRHMGVQKIDLLNRSIEKAQVLQDDCIIAYCLNDAEEIIQTDSIIINTTSVGMQSSQSPIEYSLIHENQVLIDIIYTPLKTSMLKFGQSIGAVTVNGLDMFIHQGLASLDLWFGSSVSKQVNLPKLKAYMESELC